MCQHLIVPRGHGSRHVMRQCLRTPIYLVSNAEDLSEWWGFLPAFCMQHAWQEKRAAEKDSATAWTIYAWEQRDREWRPVGTQA